MDTDDLKPGDLVTLARGFNGVVLWSRAGPSNRLLAICMLKMGTVNCVLANLGDTVLITDGIVTGWVRNQVLERP